MENKYGKVSTVKLHTAYRDGRTVVEDVYFTAPFKIMTPFYEKRKMRIMLLSASAGIMEGDNQTLDIKTGENTFVEIISQSFEKIHKMEKGLASRKTNIFVDENAICIFNPLPVIPFEGSAFESEMEIELKDSTSKFILTEILSCGRSACNERFKYRFYKSKVTVRQEEKFVYLDNVQYMPDRFDMQNIGMYEEYTHLATILICNFNICENVENDIWELLCEAGEIDGGITKTAYGALVVRAFGKRAQPLQELQERIVNMVCLQEFEII